MPSSRELDERRLRRGAFETPHVHPCHEILQSKKSVTTHRVFISELHKVSMSREFKTARALQNKYMNSKLTSGHFVFIAIYFADTAVS